MKGFQVVRASAGVEGKFTASVSTNIAKPIVEKGYTLVKNKVAGVNFIDIYFMKGLYPKKTLTFTLGTEGSGVIAGTNQRVAYTDGTCSGSYAEFTSVRSDRLLQIPDDVPDEIAVALMTQGLTAHYLTRSVFPLRKGHTCLVWAASGGTGNLTCQLAKIAGANVIGISGKVDDVKKSGIKFDLVIDSKAKDIVEQVMKFTNNTGCDVVYDSVGAKTYVTSLNCLKKRGLAVFFGNASGPIPPLNLLELSSRGSLFVTRPTLFDYIAIPGELDSRGKDLFEMYRQKKINVRIDKECKLEDASAALEFLERGNTTGKVLLHLDNNNKKKNFSKL